MLGTTGASRPAFRHFPLSHRLPGLGAPLRCEAEAGFQGSGAPLSSLEPRVRSSPSAWKAPRPAAGKRGAIFLVKWHQVAKKMWHRDESEQVSEPRADWGRGGGTEDPSDASPDVAGRACPHPC